MRILEFGFRILVFGLWILGFGIWTLNFDVLKIDSGCCPWIVTLGFGSDSQRLRYCRIYFIILLFLSQQCREDIGLTFFSLTRFTSRK